MIGDQKFYSRAETAKRLGISVDHLDRERRLGKIRAHQRAPGCRVRYTVEQMQAYAAGHDALSDELAAKRKQLPA